jgi:hypothetical protein
MLTVLKAFSSLASLAKAILSWVRDEKLVNQGRKEQQNTNLNATIETVQEANEVYNKHSTVDDALDVLRGTSKSSDK